MTTQSPAALKKATETRAWVNVARAYNLCEHILSARLATIGLRVAEHEILAHVFHTPGLTQQALAKVCFVAKSGMSMSLSKMEAQGLLARESDAKDGRIKRLTLSTAGLALVQTSLSIQADIVATMMSSLNDSEVQAMSELSQRIGVRLDAVLAAS